MPRGFQTLLALEGEHPAWIARVKERVDPNAFEVSGLLHRLERRGDVRAVVFENVMDMEGRPWLPQEGGNGDRGRHVGAAGSLPPARTREAREGS